jgi:hypothetical protein
LAKIAEGHVFYDHATGQSARDWSGFHVRNLGLVVQRRMKKDFRGRADEFRAAAESSVAKALGISPRRWPQLDQNALANWAPVLYVIRDLTGWPTAEKKKVVRIIRAKGSGTETEYLSLLQSHPRLRDAVLALGSSAKARGK